jgi:sugar phosphate isomerase/epimerase
VSRAAGQAIAVPRLKGRFPFRLGMTSYIIPADVEPNVRVLTPWVDDVELVLFESDEMSNLPDEPTIDRLGELAGRSALSYTVHLPLDADLGAADEGRRRASVEKCLRVVRLTRRLRPHAWVVHVPGERRGEEPAEDVTAWRDRLDRSAAELVAAGAPPERLAVETLDYAFELVMPVVERHGLAVCVDVGHLILAGRDPVGAVAALRDRCRVAHLHGVREGRDHVDVGALGPALLQGLYHACAAPGAPCVVTLEVFSREDFERSMAVLEETWP